MNNISEYNYNYVLVGKFLNNNTIVKCINKINGYLVE